MGGWAEKLQTYMDRDPATGESLAEPYLEYMCALYKTIRRIPAKRPAASCGILYGLSQSEAGPFSRQIRLHPHRIQMGSGYRREPGGTLS